MAVATLDNRTARRLFLARHGLGTPPSGKATGADLLEVIDALGFVQLDSINTVARAHDMILFARRARYRCPDLPRLYGCRGTLFEHWTHDAAVIPMAYYHHWHLRFQRDAERLKKQWSAARREGFVAQFDEVLTHIRDNGPCGSSDVGRDEKKGSGGWWDWHPSKTALEYLWRSGALTVIGRDGFQKRYDLTERVIDETLLNDNARPDPEETIDWLCNGALDRLGFATSGELAGFWATASPAETRDWCNRAQSRGEIEQVRILCADGRERMSFARPDTVEQATQLPSAPARMRCLSPFDPALRDRARTERLFGFHYRIEVFVPAAKRKYGYYVFPLLEGDRLVGRIDMKAHRDQGELRVKALWPEAGVAWSPARHRRLEAELDRIARLANVERICFADDWLRELA